MQEYEDSPEDEKPPTNMEDRSRVARHILQATSSASEVDKPVAGPSRSRVPSPVRYSVSYNRLTYIHSHAPIMSPQVLVCCPPFTPCPPSCPSPPICPQGVVYLHPHPLRPPTPLPPSPPPPAPRLEVYQKAPLPEPAVQAAPAVPVAPVPLDPIPWWIGLLQGPHQAVSAALLQGYLALLEYMYSR